ncbi:hypothetical protein GEMRC1_013450 [Eukaryota sp. GEM-RC1]
MQVHGYSHTISKNYALNLTITVKVTEDKDFCDNASSHRLGSMELEFLKVEYFPSNTTSLLQPLEAGIIRSFKAKNRRMLLFHIIEQVESNALNNCHKAAEQVTVLDVMNWCAKAWAGVTDVTIRNC